MIVYYVGIATSDRVKCRFRRQNSFAGMLGEANSSRNELEAHDVFGTPARLGLDTRLPFVVVYSVFDPLGSRYLYSSYIFLSPNVEV